MRVSLTLSFILSVCIVGSNAHGQVQHVYANGVTNLGPNQYYALDPKNKLTAVRMQYQASSPTYVSWKSFSDNSKMSCEGASKSGAPTSLTVSAGSTLSISWSGASKDLFHKPGTGGVSNYSPWVHAMGPISDYITSCGNAPCKSFDATNAGWTRLAGSSIDWTKTVSKELRETMKEKPEVYYPLERQGKGLWAMAKFLQNGSKWDVKIPKELANGEYIVRNELAAVHSPKVDTVGRTGSGPQVYIACVQIKVINGGSKHLPPGTPAGRLYDPNGSLANINVYEDNLKKFTLPGPAVWNPSRTVANSDDDQEEDRSLSNTTIVTSKKRAMAVHRLGSKAVVGAKQF